MTDNEMISQLRERGYTVLTAQEDQDLRHRLKQRAMADAAEYALVGYTRGLTGLQVATKLKVMSRR